MLVGLISDFFEAIEFLSKLIIWISLGCVGRSLLVVITLIFSGLKLKPGKHPTAERR